MPSDLEPTVAPEAPSADAARGETGDTVHRLHPYVLRLRIVQAAVAGTVAALVAVTVLLVRGDAWAVLPALGAAAALAGGLAAYARASAARLTVRLLPDGVLVERGVWWRSEVFIPRSRVQHTDVAQGPLDRHFGLATLKIFTAASHLGVTQVAGLAHASAVALRDALLGRQGSDAV